MTVKLKVTAATFAGIPFTPPTWKETGLSGPTGAPERVSRARNGATGTIAPASEAAAVSCGTAAPTDEGAGVADAGRTHNPEATIEARTVNTARNVGFRKRMQAPKNAATATPAVVLAEIITAVLANPSDVRLRSKCERYVSWATESAAGADLQSARLPTFEEDLAGFYALDAADANDVRKVSTTFPVPVLRTAHRL
ncbi:hypothetical protein GCM10027405_31620 [Arthrobacter alkaliphilus]